jgi:hypothetical protein
MTDTTTPDPDVIFDITEGGWRVIARDVDGPDAHLDFEHNGKPYRSFDYPAYRVWNIAAHFGDIIADFEEELAADV